jgi:hypothetical protein
MPRIIYNSFVFVPHYAVVGVPYTDRNILLLFFYLLAGESLSMVGFSPDLNFESVGRTSWGLSIMDVLVKVS